MKVLITGRYQPEYNRNSILLAGLRNIGIDLIEFRYQKKNRQTKIKLEEYDQKVDFIFVPVFMHMDVAFVKRHTTKPLIFDPLISRYMSKAFDYRKVYPYSIRALKNYLKDYIMMKKADIVLADTLQHLKYYQEVIKVNPDKIYILPVGVDISKFYPIKSANIERKFRIGFYGSYIPLHGIEKIVAAARLLEENKDIIFEIVGSGFTEKKIKQQFEKAPSNNLLFKDWVDYTKLNETINTFDICMGIFGDTIKTEVVVPNKIYHYAACGKCIITKDTPAIKEVFVNQKNIILTDGSAENLVEKILQMKKEKNLRENIGLNALKLMQEQYNQDIIAERLIEIYHQNFGKKTL